MTALVKGRGPSHPKVAFIGMAPWKDELRYNIPFAGSSGQLFDRALKNISFDRASAWVGNVSETLLEPGKSLWTRKDQTVQDIERLKDELQRLRPNVIVPMGDEAFSIITGLSGITKWRGSICSAKPVMGSYKCIPTVHPSWINRGLWKWENIFTYVDLARAIEESEFPEIKLPERHCIIAPSFKQVLAYIEECEKHDILSFDIEVFGYSPSGHGQISCIGIGYKPNEAMCIPLVKNRSQPYWSVYEEVQIWKALARLLQNNRIRKVGQNLSFEWIYFWLHGIYPSNMWCDTMLLHHSLYPDFGGAEDTWIKKKRDPALPGHGLAFINSCYTKTPYYKDDGRKLLPGSNDQQFWRYNCYDVMCTLDAGLQMVDEAQASGIWEAYVEDKIKPFLHCVRMEWQGVGFDNVLKRSAALELSCEAWLLQRHINECLGRELNVNSPLQMQELLYEQMGLKPQYAVRKTKTGERKKTLTANRDTLIKFQKETEGDNNAVIGWVNELRATLDLKSDIIDQKVLQDGNIHSHWNQGGTDSGRWACGKSILGYGMNLMNPPRKGIARRLFIPR